VVITGSDDARRIAKTIIDAVLQVSSSRIIIIIIVIIVIIVVIIIIIIIIIIIQIIITIVFFRLCRHKPHYLLQPLNQDVVDQAVVTTPPLHYSLPHNPLLTPRHVPVSYLNVQVVGFSSGQRLIIETSTGSRAVALLAPSITQI
jgi:hypothetical protein